MRPIKKFRHWDAIKLLAHPARSEIVQLCRAQPRSIQELSRALELNPGSVHNHVHRLRDAGFLALAATRMVRGAEEKRYRTTARFFDLGEVRAADVPRRNQYIARDVQRELLRLLEEDARTTARRASVWLSAADAARARALLEELHAFLDAQDGSGPLRCTLLTAFGTRRSTDER
jgi:DNA-binding transcriptional ArsR family regulator